MLRYYFHAIRLLIHAEFTITSRDIDAGAISPLLIYILRRERHITPDAAFIHMPHMRYITLYDIYRCILSCRRHAIFAIIATLRRAIRLRADMSLRFIHDYAITTCCHALLLLSVAITRGHYCHAIRYSYILR